MYTNSDMDSISKEGNIQELETIYDEHVGKVYKYFYINCLNRQIAEDLTSQVFTEFVSKFKEKKLDKPKQYLFSIMRNTWAEYLRQKYQMAVSSIENYEDFEFVVEDSINSYETKNLRDRAMYYIKLLPKSQRKIATLRLIEEKSITEVAESLNTSSSYVKTTQNRAIKSLKRLLSDPISAKTLGTKEVTR